MTDVYVKDLNIGISCPSIPLVVGQNSVYGPATFQYQLVNDSSNEAYVSMIATLTDSADPTRISSFSDLNRYLAPGFSYTQLEFALY